MMPCTLRARRSRKAFFQAVGLLCCGPERCWRSSRATTTIKGTRVEMVRKALSWPARQIAINAGEDGSLVIGKIQEKDTYAFGFDAQTGQFGDLVSKGIIDPTKVVRAALQGAASIAGLLITTRLWWPSCRRRKLDHLLCLTVAAWAEWTSKDRYPQVAKRRPGVFAQPTGLHFRRTLLVGNTPQPDLSSAPIIRS